MGSCKSPIAGVLNVVDPESIDETNPQRYVLTDCGTRVDKVELAASSLQNSSVKIVPLKLTWADFIATGKPYSLVATAVDTAEARVEIQAGLPKHILNAWTQHGDLGVSRHSFVGGQACLACLYIPLYARPSEDLLVQQAIRYSGDIMAIRNLLYTNEPLDMNWIERIADDMRVDRNLTLPFLGRPLRELYQKGICGGILRPVVSRKQDRDYGSDGISVGYGWNHARRRNHSLQYGKIIVSASGHDEDQPAEVIRPPVVRT